MMFLSTFDRIRNYLYGAEPLLKRQWSFNYSINSQPFYGTRRLITVLTTARH
jgi:hypothetical protein